MSGLRTESAGDDAPTKKLLKQGPQFAMDAASTDVVFRHDDHRVGGTGSGRRSYGRDLSLLRGHATSGLGEPGGLLDVCGLPRHAHDKDRFPSSARV